MPIKVVIHVVKNAAPPVVTVVGLDIGYLLGGSILVEAVVNWPGGRRPGELCHSAARHYPSSRVLC